MNGFGASSYTHHVESRSAARILKPVAFFGLALAYGALMVVVYRLLSLSWGYLGFDYRPLGATVGPLVVIASLPALMLPSRPRSLAEFGSWLLFFSLFQPAMIIPQLQGWVLGSDAALLLGVLFLSTIVFIGMARVPFRPWPVTRFDNRLFWIAVLTLWTLMHAALILYFGSTLSLAGIEEVYEQRADAVMQLGSGYIVYVITNAAGAVNPLLIAIGLHERKWWAVGLGVLGQLLVYATLAGKIVLVYPIIIAGVFLMFTRGGEMRPIRIGLVLVAVALLGVPLQAGRHALGDTAQSFIDLIYMRTLYLPGVLVGAYSDFFSVYPLTFFSHSIVGRMLVEYPYGDWSVGQVVGAYVTPGSGYRINNYNANFIAADGIAGLGLVGIPLVVLAAAMILRLMDKLLSRGIDLRLLCAAYVPFLTRLADGSLPTALLTGGGVLLTILLWLYAGTKDREAHGGSQQ